MVYTIPENVTDLADLAIKTSSQIDILFPLILFFVWIVIAGAGYFSEERRLGRGQFAFWATLGGLITTTVSFILFLVDGLVNLETIGICIALTFGFAMWFFIASRD